MEPFENEPGGFLEVRRINPEEYMNPRLSEVYPPKALHQEVLKRYLPRIIDEIRNILPQIDQSDWTGRIHYDNLERSLELLIGPPKSHTRVIEGLISDQIKGTRPPNENLSPELVMDIVNTYEKAGYVFQYFGFMNIHNPFVQARLGELSLTPKSFEQGVSSKLRTYPTSLAAIENPPNIRRRIPGTHRKRTVPGAVSILTTSQMYGLENSYVSSVAFPGWTKRRLRQAIINSGLGEVDSNGKMVLPGEKIGIPVGRTYIDHNENTEYFSGNLPGIFNAINPRNPSGRGNARGLPYMPRPYYEAIYRKIFSTPIYINWQEYCNSAQPKDLNNLRFIALDTFGFTVDEINSFPSVSLLCKLLQEESQRRKSLLRSIAQEAAEIAPALIFQPGSIFVRSTRSKLIAPTPVQEHTLSAYEVDQACRDPNVSKGYLVFLAERMGIRNMLPRDLSQVSKEQICKVLQRYVAILEETRRPI